MAGIITALIGFMYCFMNGLIRYREEVQNPKQQSDIMFPAVHRAKILLINDPWIKKDKTVPLCWLAELTG